MIDHLFSLVLTFCVLVGGTLAIGSELLAPTPYAPADTHVAQLPRVVVNGKKIAAPTTIARAEAGVAGANFIE